jgi:hypothetical protein
VKRPGGAKVKPVEYEEAGCEDESDVIEEVIEVVGARTG